LLAKGADPNSLMNICFLRALTNIRIGDKNPLTYFQDFQHIPGFDGMLDGHLIPAEFIKRNEFQASDYGKFLNARADRFAERLKQSLPEVEVSITE
jgi:hypothetical protein